MTFVANEFWAGDLIVQHHTQTHSKISQILHRLRWRMNKN